MLTENLDISTTYLPLISFAVTFVAIVIIVHFLARILEKFLQVIALGFVNRISGLIFGILKTAFIISILLVIVNGINRRINKIPEETINNSLLYQPLSKFAPSIFPYLNFDTIIEKSEENIEKVIT